MKEKTEVKVGTKIKDNDPRFAMDRPGAARIGEVIALHPFIALVQWNTGSKTRVRLDRIGVRSRTGYSILEQP
jgi:hypothetical protein